MICPGQAQNPPARFFAEKILREKEGEKRLKWNNKYWAFAP